jgi:hypothetical protein
MASALRHGAGRFTQAGRTITVADGLAWQDGPDGRPQPAATLMCSNGRADVRH